MGGEPAGAGASRARLSRSAPRLPARLPRPFRRGDGRDVPARPRALPQAPDPLGSFLARHGRRHARDRPSRHPAPGAAEPRRRTPRLRGRRDRTGGAPRQPGSLRWAARAASRASLTSGTATRGATLSGRLLLSGQAALATALIVGALLLGRSFAALLAVDLGFEPEGAVAARIHPPAGMEQPELARLVETLVERLRAQPGVRAAGAANVAPLDPVDSACRFSLAPADVETPEPVPVRCYAVTPGYAEALGLQLRRGRFLDSRDRSRPVRAFLVNEAFVRLAGRAADELMSDRTLRLAGELDAVVVGIVGDVLKEGPTGAARAEMYWRAAPSYGAMRFSFAVVARTAGDPGALAGRLNTLVGEIAPGAAADHAARLEDQLSVALARPRFATSVLSLLAALATLLAAIGFYAALARDVARRDRELGVRRALGAAPGQLAGLVIRSSLRVALPGIAGGLALAGTGSRLLAGLLFGIAPLDQTSFGLSARLVLAIAGSAACVPALRAGRNDPARSLRAL